VRRWVGVGVDVGRVEEDGREEEEDAAVGREECKSVERIGGRS